MEFKATQLDAGKLTSADGFGSREFLKNDYLKRMASAALGIYGDSKEEAIYPAIRGTASDPALTAVTHTIQRAPRLSARSKSQRASSETGAHPTQYGALHPPPNDKLTGSRMRGMELNSHLANQRLQPG